MITLWTDTIAIHFIQRVKKKVHFVYKVEVENISDSGADFDMSLLTSKHGTNILRTQNIDIQINEDKLLTTGHIVLGGKREKGLVAFVKNDIATNAPLVCYNGKSVRLDFNERGRRRGRI